jgi:hypothetical protein
VGPGLPGQGQHGLAVHALGRETDTGIADFGGADQFVQGDLVGLGDGEEEFQAGAARSGWNG